MIILNNKTYLKNCNLVSIIRKISNLLPMKLNSSIISPTSSIIIFLSTLSNAQNWNLVWADELTWFDSVDEDKWFHQTQYQWLQLV